MNCLCANTRRAARSLTRLYEEHLRSSGLTPAQYGLLSMLAERSRAGQPGMAQADLCEAFDLDQTTMSRNLKLLAANQWVKRVRSSQDRRQTIYTVTARGIEVRQTALPHWQRAQAEMRQALGPEFDSALALMESLSVAAATLSAA